MHRFRDQKKAWANSKRMFISYRDWGVAQRGLASCRMGSGGVLRMSEKKVRRGTTTKRRVERRDRGGG
jgi:hypothetical protein